MSEFIPYRRTQMQIIGEFRSSAGTLLDPATVTLEVQRPDGVRETFTGGQLTHGSTGIYSRDYTVTLVGHYDYVWVTTGPGIVVPGMFDVPVTVFD
jgi:hypothetical protein